MPLWIHSSKSLAADGVLRVGLAAVHCARARRLAAEGPHRDAVEDHRVEVELAGHVEGSEQVGLEPLPDAGLLPGPESAMGGAAGAAPFRRDVLPSGAGVRMNRITRSAVRWSILGRPPLGPMGCSGGRCWATASKNSSGMWAAAMAIVLELKRPRPVAQNLSRGVLSGFVGERSRGTAGWLSGC
jgi:hypothetical protein